MSKALARLVQLNHPYFPLEMANKTVVEISCTMISGKHTKRSMGMTNSDGVVITVERQRKWDASEGPRT